MGKSEFVFVIALYYDSNPRTWVIPITNDNDTLNLYDSNPRPWVILLVYLLVLVGGPDSNHVRG